MLIFLIRNILETTTLMAFGWLQWWEFVQEIWQAFWFLLCFVVGRLHSMTCIIELKVWFSFNFVHILLDCRIRNGENGIHFLLNRDGKRRGDALIEMESEQDVQKALEKHRMYMGQRYVEGTWSHVTSGSLH